MVYDDWNRVESPRRTFFCFALLAAVVSPSTARGRCQAGTESPKDSVDLELQSITRARLNRCSPYFKLLDPPPKITNWYSFLDAVHAGDLASRWCHCEFALMILMLKIGVMVAGATI